MEKLLENLAKFIGQLTVKRVALLAVVVAIALGGYAGYLNISQTNTPQLLATQEMMPVAIDITGESTKAIDGFMRKYPNAAYLTVLKMDFSHNIRTPIHRSFNDKELETIIYTRLKGGDGSLPIFLRDDAKNNNQMITIIQGGLVCSPFKDGGLARVWPDLAERLTISCRVTIPPAYSLARGYVVVHLTSEMRPYEYQVLQDDLIFLAQTLYDIDTKRSSRP
jgi:hypothetical protein